MFRFESLEVWKISIEFSKDIYILAHKFPPIENFALADQLRRAAVSVSANIAEGSASPPQKDFQNFLSISANPVRTGAAGLADGSLILPSAVSGLTADRNRRRSNGVKSVFEVVGLLKIA